MMTMVSDIITNIHQDYARPHVCKTVKAATISNSIDSFMENNGGNSFKLCYCLRYFFKHTHAWTSKLFDHDLVISYEGNVHQISNRSWELSLLQLDARHH